MASFLPNKPGGQHMGEILAALGNVNGARLCCLQQRDDLIQFPSVIRHASGHMCQRPSASPRRWRQGSRIMYGDLEEVVALEAGERTQQPQTDPLPVTH